MPSADDFLRRSKHSTTTLFEFCLRRVNRPHAMPELLPCPKEGQSATCLLSSAMHADLFFFHFYHDFELWLLLYVSIQCATFTDCPCEANKVFFYSILSYTILFYSIASYHIIQTILSHLNSMIVKQFLKMNKANHPLHHLIPHRQIDISQRETRGSNRLCVPHHRLNIRKKAFVLQATQLFNSGSIIWSFILHIL